MTREHERLSAPLGVISPQHDGARLAQLLDVAAHDAKALRMGGRRRARRIEHRLRLNLLIGDEQLGQRAGQLAIVGACGGDHLARAFLDELTREAHAAQVAAQGCGEPIERAARGAVGGAQDVCGADLMSALAEPLGEPALAHPCAAAQHDDVGATL